MIIHYHHIILLGEQMEEILTPGPGAFGDKYTAGVIDYDLFEPNGPSRYIGAGGDNTEIHVEGGMVFGALQFDFSVIFAQRVEASGYTGAS